MTCRILKRTKLDIPGKLVMPPLGVSPAATGRPGHRVRPVSAYESKCRPPGALAVAPWRERHPRWHRPMAGNWFPALTHRTRTSSLGILITAWQAALPAWKAALTKVAAVSVPPIHNPSPETATLRDQEEGMVPLRYRPCRYFFSVSSMNTSPSSPAAMILPITASSIAASLATISAPSLSLMSRCAWRPSRKSRFF